MFGSRERAEFDRLVREHLADALRLATRLCGDAHQGEDLAQEALYRAARGWKSFRKESSFQTWIYRIVVNTFRDSLRSQKQTGELPDQVIDRRRDQSSTVMQQELQDMVRQQIARLPQRQKEVVTLRIVEEVSSAETAKILGVTEANVHATLHTARKRLKQELSHYLESA